MSDLIERQATITLPVMPKEYREYQTFNLDDAYEQGWNDLQKCIESLPSAQPEIIRCGECVHHVDNFFCRKANHHTSNGDDCMSVFGAERRTDESD